MTTKKPTSDAPLISPPPKAKPSTKGEPETTSNTPTVVVGNNTNKPDNHAPVDFNMRVPAAFKTQVDTFLAANGLKRRAYVMDLIARDMKAKGWESN